MHMKCLRRRHTSCSMIHVGVVMKKHLLVPAMLVFSILLMVLPNGVIAQTTLPWDPDPLVLSDDVEYVQEGIPYFQSTENTPPLDILISGEVSIDNGNGAVVASIQQTWFNDWEWDLYTFNLEIDPYSETNVPHGWYRLEWDGDPGTSTGAWFDIYIEED